MANTTSPVFDISQVVGQHQCNELCKRFQEGTWKSHWTQTELSILSKVEEPNKLEGSGSGAGCGWRYEINCSWRITTSLLHCRYGQCMADVLLFWLTCRLLIVSKVLLHNPGNSSSSVALIALYWLKTWKCFARTECCIPLSSHNVRFFSFLQSSMTSFHEW